ncbi:HYR domain-containing protein, partial [Saprospiraceae bacterium]|nr:HYR domain-containing protein [Saprospiraceae bacterium]
EACDYTVTYSDSQGGTCPVLVTRTYVIVDACGNSTNDIQTITVEDTTDPVIAAPADISIEACAADATTVTAGNAGFAYSETSVTLESADVITFLDLAGASITEACDYTVTYIDSQTAAEMCGILVTRAYTITDACGNDSSDNQIITVEDTTDPTWDDPSGLPSSFSQDLASTECNFNYFVEIPDASDNCDDDLSVTLTATDVNNNVLTVQLINNDGTAAVTLPLGVNTLTLTLVDDCINDVTHSWTVTLIDNIVPQISCPSNITVSLTADVPDPYDNAFTFQVAGGTLLDNCTINQSSFDMISEVTVNDAGGSCVDTVKRVYYIEDVSGNSSTCEQLIIVNDEVPPTISDVPDVTVQCGDSSDPSVTGEPTADDNDGAPVVTYGDVTDLSGCGGYTGTITRTWTATDACDNEATSVQVITIVDTTSPVMPETCTNISRELDMTTGLYTLTESDMIAMTVGVTDACASAAALVYSADITMFDCDDTAAPIAVTVTVTDPCGNDSACTAFVTISETAAPVAACNDITISLDGNGNYELTEMDSTSIVSGTLDNCADFTTAFDISTFDCTNVGPVLVTVTYTDNSSNTSSCTMTVTVVDDEDPTFTCVDDQAFGTSADGISGDCVYSVPDASLDPTMAADNCGVASVTHNYNMGGTSLLGEDFPIGSTTVVWTIEDDNGRTNTCTYVVVVTDDEIPTFTCVGDQAFGASTGECVYSVTDASLDPTMAADNCGVQSVTHNYNMGGTTLSGEDFPVGTTNVVWTILDDNGNSHTCTYDVVVSDDENPEITCAANDELFLDASCMQILPDYTSLTTASDNCDAEVAITQSPAAGTEYTGEQVVTVTMTATDDSNNTATCTLDVTFTDNTAPSITCPSNVTVNLDENCMIALPDYTSSATTTDNCTDGMNINVTQVPAAGTMYTAEEVVTVTLTATDGAMESVTCTFTVSVEDSEDPVATCNDITIYLDENGMASIVANDVTESLTDNCTVSSSSIDISSFDCGNVGDNTVILTVTDIYSNQGTCSSTVTVLDTLAPVVTGSITASTLEGCGAGDAPAAATTVSGLENLVGNLMIADACTVDGALNVTSSDASTGTCPLVITRTYLVVDASGNTTADIVHTITLEDTTAPVVTGSITATTVQGCDTDDAPAAATTVSGLENLVG